MDPLQQFLLEVTAKQVLAKADRKSRGRSRPLASTILRFKGNIVTYQTTSGTTPGKFWVQNIQLQGLRKNLDKVRDGKTSLLKALRRTVSSGDIRVHCNCPAYKWWGWSYISTQVGYKFGRRQNIFPKIRNPRLRGSVCKHLINALGALPFNVPVLAKKARQRAIV